MNRTLVSWVRLAVVGTALVSLSQACGRVSGDPNAGSCEPGQCDMGAGGMLGVGGRLAGQGGGKIMAPGGGSVASGGGIATGGAPAVELCILSFPTPPPSFGMGGANAGFGGSANAAGAFGTAGNSNAAGFAGTPNAGGTATDPVSGPTPQEIANARGRTRIAFLKGELSALKMKAPNGEWTKLDQHLTALRELERSVALPTAFDEQQLPANPSASPAPVPTASGAAIPPQPPQTVGPTLLRRLTRQEYRNTLQALGLTLSDSESLERDPSRPWGFDNDAGALVVSPVLGTQYSSIASKLAGQAVLPACATPSRTYEQCATAFITDFGKKAFRRPLTCAEQQAYLDLFAQDLFTPRFPAATYEESLREVLAIMLQSPNLLYRTELGNANNPGQLTSYEIASELSYLFTAGPPDAELYANADAGLLLNPDYVFQQAQRLQALPAFRPTLQGFFEMYLGIDRIEEVVLSPAEYPSFTPELARSMRLETDRFLEAVIWEGEGTFPALLAAPYSFINSRLAQHYGLPDPGQGDTLVQVGLNPSHMGLLTQASVMLASAPLSMGHPYGRSALILKQFLCQAVPAPPAGAHYQSQPQFVPNKTIRQSYAELTASPTCAGCHSLFEPLAFSLENYDRIGAFRTADRGLPIDASGSLVGTDVDGPYVGAVELAIRLAGSQQVQNCFASHAYRWAFGRELIPGEDVNVRQAANTSLSNIRAVFVALTQLETFYRRSPGL